MKFLGQCRRGQSRPARQGLGTRQTGTDRWLIEAVDEEPNLVGAPGLFGNASVCEIHIDNVSVYPNPEKTAGK